MSEEFWIPKSNPHHGTIYEHEEAAASDQDNVLLFSYSFAQRATVDAVNKLDWVHFDYVDLLNVCEQLSSQAVKPLDGIPVICLKKGVTC